MKPDRTIFNQTKQSRYNENNKRRLSESFMFSYNTISHTQKQINDDDKINQLINKNDRLRTQIKKIQKVLEQSQTPNKQQYGVKLPQIRGDVAEKQLQNAYKLIKHYQYQIQKIKSNQKQGTFANRLKKSQLMFRQKQQLRIKLKLQLQKIKKTSKNFTVALTDNKSKVDQQNKSKKLNDQLKMYQKKIQQEDKKKIFFLQTQKKKKEYILELEKKLFESGVMKSQIADVKYKIFQLNKIEINKEKQQKQVIEDRSQQAYKSLLNEVKLLKKVTITNQKLLQKFQSEKDQYSQKNRKILIKLTQTQKEIQMLQSQVNFLKKHVDPQKLKPKLKSLTQGGTNATFNIATFSSGGTQFQSYTNKNTNILQHYFPFVQIGTITKRSQKYNDRRILPKSSTKITSIQIYQNRMQLLGFQFTYSNSQQKIIGTLMQVKNQNQRHLQKKSFNLQRSDYLATIECFVNNKSIIVGLILTSLMGKVMKAGFQEGSKRFLDMSPDQFPVCVYACIIKQGIQLIGVQKFQPQSISK